MTRRHACFLLTAAGSLILFRIPLKALLIFTFQSDIYSYIPLIPVISAALVYVERKKIFQAARYGWGGGVALLFGSAMLGWLGGKRLPFFAQEDFSLLTVLAVVVCWMGLFVLCYGGQASRAALFPLLFLLLMVPLPAWLHAELVVLLRKGSAHAAALMLKWLGVPVYHEGLRLSLPRINIDVAEQCSSIRSSLALLITALLVSHLFLRSFWSKLIACGAVIPITFIKNGLRIVTLSFLLVRPEIASFTTVLHHHGGIPFSLLALMLLFPVIWLLRRLERRRVSPPAPDLH